MSTRPVPRRTVLVAAGVAPLLGLVAGCTGQPPGPDAVTPAQVDRLAGQVAAQEQLVAAGVAAFAASPELAATAAGLAAQWQEQLDLLRAAAPTVTSSASGSASGSESGSTSGSGATAPGSADGGVGVDPRADLRTRVAATADSHATACPEFTGARAALLGSIAAGLRGHGAVLA
ncbi:hypothetical protein TEK04_13405 [Klenkia sp. LSe6-5]|uniref:DUF4439 domain-containing protein n=1 Tax=Klenkia sesuvii TaxID=3103137 RepID=A0ABU8DV50_9ACTN